MLKGILIGLEDDAELKVERDCGKMTDSEKIKLQTERDLYKTCMNSFLKDA